MNAQEPIRIAVLISGGGTNLQALLDAQSAGALFSGRIKLVISDRDDAYGLERARKNGCKAVVVRRKGVEQAVFEDELLSVLDRAQIELVILAGFLCILSADFVKQYPDRILNVHPALIPSFCGEGYYGLRVHEAVLAYGVKVTGATVHLVNEIPDGGKILLQKAVEVRADDTPQTLQRRVMEEAEWILLPQAAEMMAARLLEQKRSTSYDETL
ncbi:MAG TPA: phosphoribosylglycinamide formyltransferase [Clostridiales bacterium]|nr:phosphoribosylglycinamide formyltransferase [Clostridiales bacterium]